MSQPAAVQRPVARPQPAPVPSRMRLENVLSGKRKEPVRVVLYGPEGVGKSTFGADAPKPIFLGAEDGTEELDVKRFPTPESWGDVFDALHVLATDQHDYETLVVDSLDWVEPLIWARVCADANVATIEDVGGGYGKGYQAALDQWRRFLGALEQLRKAKPMNVILLAHSHIKTFKNPQGEDFDRYILKINEKAAGLIKEWAAAVLFANWETFAKEDKKTKRAKGVSTGARLIYTTRTAAFDAKSRYSIPEEIPLGWIDFEQARAAGAAASLADLRSEIERKAKELGGEIEPTIIKYMTDAGDDAARLAQINNRVNARLAEKGQQNATQI